MEVRLMTKRRPSRSEHILQVEEHHLGLVHMSASRRMWLLSTQPQRHGRLQAVPSGTNRWHPAGPRGLTRQNPHHSAERSNLTLISVTTSPFN